MKYITGAKFPPGRDWRDEGAMCGLTLWHTDRRQYALLPHWYMMCQSETRWIGGGYLIFWPSSRLVCGHTHTRRNIQFTRVTFICLRLPHLSSWLEPWTAAPLNQTSSIHAIELLHRCAHWVHRCVCVYLCLSEWVETEREQLESIL